MEKFHIPKPFSSFLGLFWYFFLLGFPAQYCSSFLSSTVHIHTIHNHSKIYTTNSYKHRLSPPIFSHVLYHHWSIFCILTFFNYGHLIFFVFSSACFLIFVLWSLQSFNNIFLFLVFRASHYICFTLVDVLFTVVKGWRRSPGGSCQPVHSNEHQSKGSPGNEE